MESFCAQRRAKGGAALFKAIESLESRRMLAAHVVGNPATFATIQAAIDAAPAGGTVTVDAGNYTEQVIVYNGVNVKGAQAGVDARSNLRGSGESIITGITQADGTVSYAFKVVGNDCTIDGFTVQGQTSQSTAVGAGIVINPTVAGSKILNNIVQNNCTGLYLANASATDGAVIKGNIFRDNNTPGPNFGRAIYTDAGLTNGLVQNVTIDGNYFYNNLGGGNFGVQAAIGLESFTANSQANINVTNNVFDHNGKAVLAFDVNGLTFTGNFVVNHFDTTSAALRIEGGVTNVLVQNNNFYADGARAIRIDNKAVPRSNNTFTITNNNIYTNGLEAEHSGLYINAGGFDGTLNATNNWWGASNGPSGDFTGSGDAIQLFGNLATFQPFATAPIIDRQGPWYGRPFDMNGNIQMEDYDHGLEGVSYHDTGSGNSGGSYRPNADVDISTTSDTGGGYVVTPSSGEWLEYTVNVANPGTHTFSARYASSSSGSFHVEVDGVNVTGSVSSPSTGSSSAFATLNKTGVNLPGGVHIVRVVFDSGSFGNWNWMQFAPTNVNPPPPAPTAPTGLASGTVTATSIALSWTDTSSNEDNFILERSIDNVIFTTVATPPANATSYTDTNLSPSTLYSYRIRATNAGGTSSPSNIASATTLAQTSGPVTYISTGSTWKYLDNGTNQGTAWRAIAFSDTTWKSGAAQLGYGDGDEATVVSFGSNANGKFITTYFRKSFSVADASLVSALNLRVLRDDGVVIYLNGTEVFRNNMPTGTIASTTLASTAVEENTFFTGTISSALLVSGTNVIAVEIHQADVTSSDISFDFELKGTVSQTSTPPPLAPSGLAASAVSASQINLSWSDNSSDETGFIVERSTDNVTFTQIGTTAANTAAYNDSTGLLPNKQYFYRVRATNNGNNSTPSNTANATTLDVAPAAPTNLAASAISPTQINLTWTDASSNETGFILERSTDNFVSNVTQIATPAANVTSYSDTTGLTASTQYWYRIRAVNGIGPSGNSNVATATTPAVPTVPNAPGGLGASAVSASQINLTWTDNSTNETGFVLERSTDNFVANVTQIATPVANATSYNDSTGLLPNTKYYYRIRATNGVGPSANSNIASATTLTQTSGPVTYIPTGSTWKYLDTGTNQGTAWRAIAFNDTTWKSGAAQLGYGDGDEATVVSFGSNANSKFITTYFRKSFSVADASLVSALNLRVLRDDGVVIYLNGTEVFRNNMPTGTIASTTLASTAIGGVDETTFLTGTISPALLVSGSNVIAVEIHQADVSSSDISFDFELKATVSQPSTPPPAAPSGLAASAVSTSQINLSWTDNSNDETGFIVERSTDNFVSNVTQIATPAANATTYNDSTGLSPSTKYYYRVRATNNGNSSTPSNVANATTLDPAPVAPAAPSALGASAVSSSQINLTWTDNANNETGFIIERSTDNFVSNVAQIATPAANATGYSDSTGLSASTKYYYRVRATNGVGPSGNSNVANATTLAATSLPSPWVQGDIGATGAAGSATYSNGVYTISGAGDVWSTADAFHFVYQPWSGNGQIIARYAGIVSGTTNAFAGIMFRESLAANAREVSLLANSANQIGFVRRTTTGGSSTANSAAAGTPYWLKLIRSGNSFSAYRSPDGVTWTQVGSTLTVPMNSSIFVGLLAATGTLSGTQLATFNLDGVSTSTSTSSNLAGTLSVPASPLSIDQFASSDVSNASALLDLTAN
jgi:titin